MADRDVRTEVPRVGDQAEGGKRGGDTEMGVAGQQTPSEQVGPAQGYHGDVCWIESRARFGKHCNQSTIGGAKSSDRRGESDRNRQVLRSVLHTLTDWK